MKTIDDVYNKLEEMHKLLKELKQEEDFVVQEEHKIEMEEEELLKLLKANVKKQFEDVLEWKKFVWDSCQFKKQKVKKELVDFICNKTGNCCRFIDCPKNRVID